MSVTLKYSDGTPFRYTNLSTVKPWVPRPGQFEEGSATDRLAKILTARVVRLEAHLNGSDPLRADEPAVWNDDGDPNRSPREWAWYARNDDGEARLLLEDYRDHLAELLGEKV